MIRLAVSTLVTALASTVLCQGVPDILKYFAGHRGAIRAIAISPVGFTMAVAQENGPMNIFDVGTREMKSAFEGSADVMRFTPDGSKLVGGSRFGFDVWDAKTGERIRQILIPNPQTTFIRAGAISVDANFVAAVISNNTAIIWDTSNGSVVQSFATNTLSPTSASFDVDGDILAVGHQNGRLVLFNWALGTVVDEIEAHNGFVNSVSYHNDVILSAGSDHLVKTWNANTGELIRVFTGHYNPVWTAKFSSDGQRIVSGCNRRVVLWNANTGGIRGMYSSQFRFRAAEFTADGTAIIAGNDIHDVFTWETNPFHFVKNYSDHKAPAKAVAVSDDGKLFASGGTEPTIKLWRGNDLYREIYTGIYANSIDISPDGSKVVVSANLISYIFDLATGNFVAANHHNGVSYDAAFSEDSQFVYTVSTDGDIDKMPSTGGHNWTTNLTASAVRLAVSDTVRRYICVATQQITSTKVWTQLHAIDAEDGAVLRSWAAGNDYITGLQFRDNGELVASFAGGNVTAWNPDSGAQVWTRTRPAGISSFDLSPSGDVAATGGRGEVRFFKLSHGADLAHYDREIFYQVESLAISPDERWYVYGMDGGTVGRAKSPLAVDVSTATLLRGNTIGGGSASLAEWDDDVWRITPGIVFSTGQPPVEVVLQGTSTTPTPSRLKFRAVVSASSQSMSQKIELYDYSSNQWVLFDTRASSTTETGVDVQITNQAERYVHPTSLEVRARLTMVQVQPVFSSPWQARLNQAFWILVP